jgi:hypothetical protein
MSLFFSSTLALLWFCKHRLLLEAPLPLHFQSVDKLCPEGDITEEALKQSMGHRFAK